MTRNPPRSGPSAPFPLDGGRAGDGGGDAAPVGPRARHVGGAIARARRLRAEQTVAERLLWKALRERRMNFRRQAPIGPFVVDFAHFASDLIVEVDGYYHGLPERRASDAERTAWLRSQGFRLIRFAEKRVRDDLFAVVDEIVAETAPPPSPTLPPSRGKGEKRYDIR